MCIAAINGVEHRFVSGAEEKVLSLGPKQYQLNHPVVESL